MRVFAILYGVLFCILGLGGLFSDAFGQQETWWAIFGIDAWVSSFYLLSALLAFTLGLFLSRLFFQIIGIAYLIIALLSVYGGGTILGTFVSNSTNTWFQVILSIVALILGYGVKTELP